MHLLCLRKINCKFIGWRVWEQQKILCEAKIFMVWTSLHLVKNWMNLALRDKERNFENNFEKDRCVIALAEEGFFMHITTLTLPYLFRIQRPILVLQFLIPYNWRVFVTTEVFCDGLLFFFLFAFSLKRLLQLQKQLFWIMNREIRLYFQKPHFLSSRS